MGLWQQTFSFYQNTNTHVHDKWLTISVLVWGPQLYLKSHPPHLPALPPPPNTTGWTFPKTCYENYYYFLCLLFTWFCLQHPCFSSAKHYSFWCSLITCSRLYALISTSFLLHVEVLWLVSCLTAGPQFSPCLCCKCPLKKSAIRKSRHTHFLSSIIQNP